MASMSRIWWTKSELENICTLHFSAHWAFWSSGLISFPAFAAFQNHLLAIVSLQKKIWTGSALTCSRELMWKWKENSFRECLFLSEMMVLSSSFQPNNREEGKALGSRDGWGWKAAHTQTKLERHRFGKDFWPLCCLFPGSWWADSTNEGFRCSWFLGGFRALWNTWPCSWTFPQQTSSPTGSSFTSTVRAPPISFLCSVMAFAASSWQMWGCRHCPAANPATAQRKITKPHQKPAQGTLNVRNRAVVTF